MACRRRVAWGSASTTATRTSPRSRPGSPVGVESGVSGNVAEPLLDAVREASGSGHVLERLADSNVFIARRNDGHYRYHELFREALLAQAGGDV